jgi:hypothetical protein
MMKISSDAYLLMQAQLLARLDPISEGKVDVSYVKNRIDALLRENECTVSAYTVQGGLEGIRALMAKMRVY